MMKWDTRMQGGGDCLDDSEFITIFRLMSFNLDSPSYQYAASDAMPEEERTYKKLRERVQLHMANESMARRMASVCNAENACCDGLSWMSTFDIV